jgi:hypothetical protein
MLQAERLPWRAVVATLVAGLAVTYAVVKRPATSKRFPSPSAALGVDPGPPAGWRHPPATGTWLTATSRDGVWTPPPDEPGEGNPSTTPPGPVAVIAPPALSSPTSLDAGPPEASATAEPIASETAAASPPPPAPLSTPLRAPIAQPLTSSSFDDEDIVDRHPVPGQGSLTHSDFDGEDRIDRHPITDDESTLMSNPQPLTSSSFDEEDIVDHHAVTDEGSLTHSAFDDEDRTDRHPVP